MRTLIAVLFFAASLLAQPASDDLATVAGKVTNGSTGEPVGKAQVVLKPAEARSRDELQRLTYSAMTESSGLFALSQIEPGTYSLTVTRSGFVQGEYGSNGPGKPGTALQIGRAQKLKDIEVKLTPHAVVSGRVFDSDGEPVANASLTVLRTQYLGGRKLLVAVGRGGVTNDLGEYRIFGLPPGHYYLSARTATTATAVDRSAAPRPQTSLTTYYPRVSDPALATQFELAPGRQLDGIEVKLLRGRTYRIRGRLVNETGEPLQGQTQVHVFGRGTVILPMSFVSESPGRFEVSGLVPGSYDLHVLVLGGQRNNATVPIEITDKDIDEVAIPIRKKWELEGAIKWEDSTVTASQSMVVRLEPDNPIQFGAPAMGRVAADGAFTIRNVGDARYVPNITPIPDGHYVKSIWIGAEELLEDGIQPLPGSPAMRIVLSGKAATVQGLVKNEKDTGVSGATVVLVPESPKRRAQEGFYKIGMTDASGRYLIKNVTPGDYRVYAWQSVEEGAWMDAEFVRPVEARGKKITVREAGQESADLAVILEK